ncbi:hypothetical protein E4U14_005988 [Claviceps sp. LM454 group G7]|nr:hypothetical protein E4U14_005988 [Claviceps sp. LM454 group G7]
MASLIRGVLANARNRVSRLLVPLSQQPSSPKPVPRQQHQDEEIFEQDNFYHPVSLGDTFNSGRYSILRKLGYGRYSTVWLARDLKCQRYVALKLLTNNCYGGPYEIFEREILEKVRDVSRKSSHEGRKHVLPLNEHFTHQGPNGNHVGLTFDVLGHDLYTESMRYAYGRVPVKAVKEIVRQLLKGLDFLHTECGVIHTDLKGTNILFEIETPNDCVSKYLESAPPRTTEGQDGASIPLRECMVTEATPHVSDMAPLHVRLIDFGVASWREKHLLDQIQPLALRAPEVTLGAPWDTGVDIWNLGCLIIEFTHGFVMFRETPSKRGIWTLEDDHLAKIVEVLGPIPPSLLRKGRRTAEFLDEEGKFLRIPKLGLTSLERMLNGDIMPVTKPPDMPDDEIDVFIDFVRGMLQIDPMARKSAAQLLQHEWLS